MMRNKGSAGLLKNARRFKGEARSFEYCHFADVAIDDEIKLQVEELIEINFFI